jgi:hypothetical protein
MVTDSEIDMVNKLPATMNEGPPVSIGDLRKFFAYFFPSFATIESGHNGMIAGVLMAGS